MLFCLVYLRWVFIKGVFAVGSEAVAVCDIIIFKNIAFCRNCLLCLSLGAFDWVVAGIVFSDCLIWLIVPVGCFLLSGCDFVRKKKIMVGRCIAMLPLLNPVSKWVCSDSNGWSFNLGVYCLLWKRFCVLNVALRMTKKLNRLRNSDGYVLVFKKTQRVVWPCFNCVDFMAQTVAAYSSAHKWFWLKKNNHRNAPWKMTDTDWTKSLSF